MSSFYWFSLLPVKKTNKNYAQVAEGEGWTNYPGVGMVVISSVTTYVFRLRHDFLSAWGRHRKTGTIRIMCLSHLRLPFLQLGKGLLKLTCTSWFPKEENQNTLLCEIFHFLGPQVYESLPSVLSQKNITAKSNRKRRGFLVQLWRPSWCFPGKTAYHGGKLCS